ncbi:MAG: DUF6263 family protein [Sphingobacteriales bacterium]|nr:DUF6263 family protein [Sphingobacteriales bacterium]
MKKILSIALLLSFGISFAQNSSGIKLKKGQTITMNSVVNSETEMQMGAMKSDYNTTTKLNVIDENAETYTLNSSIAQMKMNTDAMGQNMSFDSEKPEDKDSEVGQAMGDKLKKVDTYILDKKTGKTTKVKKEGGEEEAGGMGGMFSVGDEDGAANAAFFILPAGKKIGDSWSESTTSKGITTSKIYTLKSIAQEVATIDVTGTITGTKEQEANGMTMSITMNNKIAEQMLVNVNVGLVTKVNNTTDGTNSMDMMGQQMEMTIKSSTVTTVNF